MAQRTEALKLRDDELFITRTFDAPRALVFKVLVQVAIDFYSKKVAALAAAAASPK